MAVFKTPALPQDVVLKGRQNNSSVLAKTAKAIQQVPEVADASAPGEKPDNQNPEAIAAVMYLADVMARLLNKIGELRELPLPDFNARMEAYIAETAAQLPEETRQMFLARAAVYSRAAAAEVQAREEGVEQQINTDAFARLLEGIESAALEAVTLPEQVQAQTMATALADYKHALEGGEAAGFLAPGSGTLMLEELRQDMALAAAKSNVATSDAPTFLALLIASGETGLPDVDKLPEDTRVALLSQTLKQQPPENRPEPKTNKQPEAS